MGGTFPRPKTHWRERHQEFIGAVSASRQVEHALKTGAPLPPPPKTSFNPGKIRRLSSITILLAVHYVHYHRPYFKFSILIELSNLFFNFRLCPL